MSKMDYEYFSRRMRQEREAAEHASPTASAIHKELADRYAEMAAAATDKRK